MVYVLLVNMMSVVRPVLRDQLFHSLPYPPVPLRPSLVRCVCAWVFPLLLLMCVVLV